ncbi:hypothetical protein EAF00_000387 [Botryotinia globosa]|nr:hypothetical protein EAF00_000387 [Botryotinia globosa]
MNSKANIGNRTNSASAGRLLGGSSAINGVAFLPNSKLSIEAWVSLGNPGWEAFSKSMDRFTLATSTSTTNSTKSPLQIPIPEEDTEWPRVWRDRLATLEFPVAQDGLTSGNILGSLMGVRNNWSRHDKKRSYSAKAYLDDTVRSRINLTIRTKATVERIIFENPDSDTPIAVVLRGTGTLKSVLANKEVILGGGTINSPRLLELSGVGNPKILEPIGIEVIVNNPNVGEHLQNHPLVTVPFEARDEDGFDTIDQLLRKDKEAIAKVKAAYAKGLGPESKSNLNILAQLWYYQLKWMPS